MVSNQTITNFVSDLSQFIRNYAGLVPPYLDGTERHASELGPVFDTW